jgi:hypothetical protein
VVHDITLRIDPTLVAVWAVPAIGLVAAGLTFAVGFAVAGRRRAAAPAAARPAPPAPDPFVEGSKSERRLAVRREGSLVAVLITVGDGQGPPTEGLVSDRSVGGLCLRLHGPVVPGTLLNVRPRSAPTMVPWTQVEVRSCRQQGDVWEAGCQFVRTPPWSILIQFG